MVFLMANHRSTRVEGIYKKLQTVRGAGGQLLELCRAVGDFLGRRVSAVQEKQGSLSGGREVSFWRA